MKTNLEPLAYVRLLVALGEPGFLVSAYDLARVRIEDRDAMFDELARARVGGAVVILDSGNYEKWWHRDQTWSFEEYAAVVRRAAADFAFAFDDPFLRVADSAVVTTVQASVARARDLVGDEAGPAVLPIVHGTAAVLPQQCAAVASGTGAIMIAVAERELGEGMLARIRTVRRIRKALTEVAPGCMLHVLGTGNPISILLLSCADAGSFDGLEWCQTVVDPSTAILHHFQHRELLGELGSGEREVVGGLPYPEGTLTHNLFFYRAWMRKVREALRCGGGEALLAQHVRADRLSLVKAALWSEEC